MCYISLVSTPVILTDLVLLDLIHTEPLRRPVLRQMCQKMIDLCYHNRT